MLKSPISIDSDSIELKIIICTIMVYYEKMFKIQKSCIAELKLLGTCFTG